MHKSIPFLLVGLIIINVILASWHVLHGTINFHTDIARDFLLFEDIYYNKNITLIGPRSGGIAGVFHGPLWLYINIPAYILGSGNPVVVGWFWVLLFIISIGAVYWLGKKLFNTSVGLLAAVFYSVVTSSSIHSMFNPFGAVVLFPIFYYFFWNYTQKKRLLDLVISLLMLGGIIQFQMAFGVPILILILPIMVYVSFKHKKWNHLLSLLLLAIPLSSYIVFELRNDFLQIRSALEFISGKRPLPDKFNIPLYEFLYKRVVAMIKNSAGMIVNNRWLLIVGFIASVSYVWFKRAANGYRDKFALFYYLFFGYWIVTLAFKGTLWNYYYWPFITLFSVVLASIIAQLKKKELIYGVIFLVFAYSTNLYLAYKQTVGDDFSSQNGALWSFYEKVAETVYKDAPPEFGYYIYTQDQFGYSTRHAMNYVPRKYPDKNGVPFEKRKYTYLLVDDNGEHKLTNHNDWQKYDIKIERKPDSVQKFTKAYSVETYILTPEELAIPSNPDLIHTLIFR